MTRETLSEAMRDAWGESLTDSDRVFDAIRSTTLESGQIQGYIPDGSGRWHPLTGGHSLTLEEIEAMITVDEAREALYLVALVGTTHGNAVKRIDALIAAVRAEYEPLVTAARSICDPMIRDGGGDRWWVAHDDLAAALKQKP